jgi:hypothetical protein
MVALRQLRQTEWLGSQAPDAELLRRAMIGLSCCCYTCTAAARTAASSVGKTGQGSQRGTT